MAVPGLHPVEAMLQFLTVRGIVFPAQVNQVSLHFDAFVRAEGGEFMLLGEGEAGEGLVRRAEVGRYAPHAHR